MTKDEALEIEALKLAHSAGHGGILREMKVTPFTIKEALAQPVQEPVEDVVAYHSDGTRTVRIAPKRPWVGLTDEEIDQGLLRTPYAMKTAEAWREGVRWAYHQLKEKNT